MRNFTGPIARSTIARGIIAMVGGRSPWGGKGGSESGGSNGSGEGPGGSGDTGDKGTPPRGPRNPWLPPGSDTPPRRSANIEDIFRARNGRGNRRGNGSGRPPIPDLGDAGKWLPLFIGGMILLWLGFTMTHILGPKQQGIITTFGKYSRTIGPGVSFSLPWPIQSVTTTDVTSIRRDSIPENDSEKLMLTSDQNLVDLSYLIRWSIKDLKLYTFELDDPEQAVREVAEAAMRASIAEVPLDDAMGGAGRAQVEQRMRSRMQAILDAYRSGVLIQGVEIKKADPPAKTIAAFQQVTSAQQDAQRSLSNAQAWSEQVIARAQGDAAAFDKVYEEYRLAPKVTRQRMYYETMERVLANNDKVIIEAPGVTPYMFLPQNGQPPAIQPPIQQQATGDASK